MTHEWQRNFFLLAGTFLACRWALIHEPGDPMWYMLGCLDYYAEMLVEINDLKEKQCLATNTRSRTAPVSQS